MVRIGIIGEFDPSFEPHVATNDSIEHARAAVAREVSYAWVSTRDLDHTFFSEFAGAWVAPGSPYKDMERTLQTIQFARENGVPMFGTCGGFQHMLIEYARNVLGLTDAQHAEYDPYASCLFISELSCSLAGREMEIQILPGSQAARIYSSSIAKERYYCNFSVNPQYVDRIKCGSLRISGTDNDGEVRIVELPGHPFFMGTLFVPQAISTCLCPHPLINAFLVAVSKHRVRSR